MGPTRPGLVSYPLCEVLGSCGCGCRLAVVVYLLVSLLGIVVFVVFSKIYMFLGGDSHCRTHAPMLAPAANFLMTPIKPLLSITLIIAKT